jgi:hypothetical protein
MKFRSAVETVMAAFARGTDMRNDAASNSVPSVAATDRTMNLKNREWSCSTVRGASMFVFIIEVVVTLLICLDIPFK